MRNFAGFIQDRASYQRITLNLGLRYSSLRRHDSGAEQRRRQVVPGDDRTRRSIRRYTWSTLAPRTGIVVKLTEDGKNVAKASYSRYYESMYTTEFSSINPNSIQTGGVPDLVVPRRSQRNNGNGPTATSWACCEASSFRGRTRSIRT